MEDITADLMKNSLKPKRISSVYVDDRILPLRSGQRTARLRLLRYTSSADSCSLVHKVK